MLPRWIDLQIDWLLQYVPETHLPGYPADDVTSRLSQADGYFSETSAAFLSCRDGTHSLARIEAEFSGRLLYGREDLLRWRDDASGLTWGVISLSECADLDRLPAMFDRGVRAFSPLIPHPGRDFLARLLECGAPGGPRPILDLARADPATMGEILDWFEADSQRPERILLMNRGLFAIPEHLARFRALGGTIGVRISPPHRGSTGEVREAIESIAGVPFRGEPGYRGIAIATGFLESDRTLPGLENAGAVARWIGEAFDPSAARLLIHDNASKLIEAMAGGSV